MSAWSAPLCRRALLLYALCTASGVAIKIIRMARSGAKNARIPAAGRLQDGRGSNQPGGFVSDICAGPAIISQTRPWNKLDT
jgi:hypothetical protein